MSSRKLSTSGPQLRSGLAAHMDALGELPSVGDLEGWKEYDPEAPVEAPEVIGEVKSPPRLLVESLLKL